ncbi:MAG TPA: AraC family transcriptional regulator, partial [Paludibacter sp.]
NERMKHMMNEQLQLSISSPLKIRKFDYKHFTYPWHFHSEYEIIYIKSGAGNRFVGHSSEDFADGDVLLLGSNLPHYLKSENTYYLQNSLRVQGVIVQFEKDFMHQPIDNYPHFIPIKRLLIDSLKGLYFPAGCSARLIELLEMMPLETGMKQMCSFLELLNVMTEISARQLISPLSSSKDSMSDIPRLNKVILYLNNNYIRNVGLDEIAAVASMNTSAFCRFFKNNTGRTFKHYILELRVSDACKQILSTDKSISQIGAECGFETVSYFNNVFKKNVGFTPSAYKSMMTKNIMD